jgi:voltage-gated potassium channel
MNPALMVTGLLSLEAARANGADLSYASLRNKLREAVADDPMHAALVTVVGSSVLFFLAEKGHNPKITRIEDSFVFCTTCLSVGYANSFAVTPAGKAIASALMTFGPALAAKILDPPASQQTDTKELIELQRTIADKLGAILEAVKEKT